MDISVVIPFYNGEEFIEEAVDSVLNQTYPAKEIVIINDSPSEASKEFLKRFENKVNVIHLDKNYGNSTALNIGIQHCRYEWIAFLDQDDLWANNKLEEQRRYLEEHPEVTACHTGIEVFSKGKVLQRYVDKPVRLEMKDALMIAPILPSSLIIKQDIIQKVGLFDTETISSSDRELTIRLLKAGVRIDCINQALTRLRREGHSSMTSRWKPMLKGHLQIFVKHFDQYKKHKVIRPYLKWTFLHAAHRSTGLSSIFFYSLGKLF